MGLASYLAHFRRAGQGSNRKVVAVTLAEPIIGVFHVEHGQGSRGRGEGEAGGAGQGA
jgi:hypothetical protein